ncbi:MAG: protein phosphatase 2C domain-containing protein [Candidatus Pacebacteria bacterium]|nr:protein phosphatase 2C domain-containing protein [Candidatus Paceibacterota bacterium]
MKLYADHYFHIGAAHYSSGKPCQDYSISGSNGTEAYAIVSDGCSTGGNTDVGARVLALATLQALKDSHLFVGRADMDSRLIASAQQATLKSTQLMLGLNRVDMLSTCAYIFINQNSGFVHVQGDGVIALRYRNGETMMFRSDWTKNAPFYPAYDDADAITFIDRIHGGNVVEATMSIKQCSSRVEEENINLIPFQDARSGFVVELSREKLSELEFIAVFSDGVTQVEGVSWQEAVSSLLAFKNTTGEFAKRRMIRGIKDFHQVGRGPIDDISFAVVRIEQVIDLAEEV